MFQGANVSGGVVGLEVIAKLPLQNENSYLRNADCRILQPGPADEC